MSTMLALLLSILVGVMSADPPDTGDGFPDPDRRPAHLPGVGDMQGTGADNRAIRLTDPTTGAGLFTTNTDPSIVAPDPITGEDAPTGTDVGFGAPLRRYVQTGVLNGDFALGPPDSTQAIGTGNPLPYWTWTSDTDGDQTATWDADATNPSGHKVVVRGAFSGSGTAGILSQMVPVPMSKGQQFRVLPSVYVQNVSSVGGGSFISLRRQFYAVDATTAIGSSVTATRGTTGEFKIDAGLVPTTAAYLLLEVMFSDTDETEVAVGEVRAAFLPAEATLGLGVLLENSAGITTTETVVESITIPANTLTVGSVYRVTAFATVTSTVANAVNVRLRLGPTTLTGTIVTNASNAASTTASSDAAMYVVLMTVRSVGATGTVIGHIARTSGNEPFSANEVAVSDTTATVTIDTTVANLLELTAETAAATTTITFRQAVIECVMAS